LCWPNGLIHTQVADEFNVIQEEMQLHKICEKLMMKLERNSWNCCSESV